MIPIGPAPVTSTSSPTTGNDNAVCAALPNGAKIDATSRSTGTRRTQALPAGSETYAEAEPAGLYAQVAPPGPAVAAVSADQVILAADQVTDGDVADADACLDHLAGELVPGDQPDRHVLLRPVVPVLDVQVGATQTG